MLILVIKIQLHEYIILYLIHKLKKNILNKYITVLYK